MPEAFHIQTAAGPETLLLSVVIPVRNEGDMLRVTVPLMQTLIDEPHEVIVVYDTPDDDGILAVEELSGRYPNVRGVLNTRGVGVINAFTAGVAAARGRYVLTYCADEIVPLLSVKTMVRLLEGGCEFVSATRYRGDGRRYGGSRIGGFLSRWGNRVFSWLTGFALTDCTTGVKMFRREVFNRLNLESKPVGWAVAYEMAVKAQAMGLKLGEAPIVSVDRLLSGASTFRLSRWIGEYWRWFYWGSVTMRAQMRRNRSVVRMTRLRQEPSE